MEIAISARILWVIIQVILSGYLLLSILKRKTLKSLHVSYKWVTREVMHLEALLEDYNAVVVSVEQIHQRATQFWDSELGVAGISLQLDETQLRWLRRAEYLSSEARLLINDCDNLMEQSCSFLSEMVATRKLASKMKRAMEKISDHSQNREVVKLIVESLELSKSKVRRLQDGPIDEKNHASISSQPSFRSGAALVSMFRGLITQKPKLKRGLEDQVASTEMQLMLLYAFMKDLRGLRLESAVENAWARKAQKIISATENKINTLFRHIPRFSLFCDWEARRAFKREMERLSRKVSDLLEAKSYYGFEFIRRVSSTFTHTYLLPPEFYGEIGLMHKRNAQVREQVEALGSNLERANSLLRQTMANEGARVTRTECHKQLQRLGSEARASSAAYVQGLSSWLSLPHLGRSRFLGETLAIMNQVALLEMSISAYSIKIVEDSSSVVGLEEDIHAIVSHLTAQPESQMSFFCITGIHGIGKTTLAKKIYNHSFVLNNHHVRRWFSLPRESNDFFVFMKRERRGLENPENCYLLVFDNLESKKSWDVLSRSIQAVKRKAVIKIVITTRKTTVASYVEPTKIHQIRLRTKDESWEFFTQMVPMPSETAITAAEKAVSEGVEAVTEVAEEAEALREVAEESEAPREVAEKMEAPRKAAEKVEALARKVVAKTGGLPLAILYLGYRFTVNELTHERLKRVLERVALGQNQSMWFDAQDLNRGDLEFQPILGQCLSYFESFPMDFVMPARRLVAVLVAQGLVESEGTAYAYLLELINRNMIQVVERRLDGKVKTCRFPSNLREPWQRHRREARPIRSWYLISTGLECQLTYHFSDTDANSSHRIPNLRSSSPSFLYEDRLPSSIMFFDTREGSQPGEDIGKFLNKGIQKRYFDELLVLDLEGVNMPYLPNNIGGMKQLKYLGLRWTNLECIPTSIKKMLNLQTLDVKHTSIDTLPVSVWKLTKLRHLYLNGHCRVESMPSSDAIYMPDLVTLSGAFLNKDSPLRKNLDQLANLRKLGLAFQLSDQQQEELQTSILTLRNLQSLSLSLCSVDNQELAFTNLGTLTKLSSLYLFGKLRKESLCIISTLPRSLTKLTLSASQLPEDAIRSLATLAELKSLSFILGSYQGRNMVFPRQTFPHLLVLKLWSIDPLKIITIEEGAMRSLWEMEIRSCGNLRKVNGLTSLETLQELKLTNMPTEFAAGVENNFKAATENARSKIVHTPRIRIHNCQRTETDTCGLHMV